MPPETAKDYYDEIDAPIVHEAAVNDVPKFIEEMLRLFSGKGTLYVSSYDFGCWADRLSAFKSAEKVKLNTAWQDGAFLQNGFKIDDDFVYVFRVECLNNIDARRTFNQFLIYEKGRPLLQCCSNFDDVFVNTKVPKSVVKTLTENNIVSSWK